jgi:sec-independent protein translocase protein TatA
MIAHSLIAWSPFDPMHLLVIGLIALLLFGKRLPEVGRSLGRGIMEFKKGLRDVQEELNRDEKEPPRRQLKDPEDDPAARPRLNPSEPAPTEKHENGAA